MPDTVDLTRRLSDYSGLIGGLITSAEDGRHLEILREFRNFLDIVSADLRREDLPAKLLAAELAMLFAAAVEAGQYRHEVNPAANGKVLNEARITRVRIAEVLRIAVQRPEFAEMRTDLERELVPLVESCVDRQFQYRKVQVVRAVNLLYEMRERTGNYRARWVIKHCFRLNYPLFGTSGVRGVWAKDITRRRVRASVQAVCDYMKAAGVGDTVVIGYDSRLRADIVAGWAAEVCLANGFRVAMTSRDTPTPVINFWATHKVKGNAAGIIICTASHNPYEWQGIKFTLPNGAPGPTSATNWIGSRTSQILISAEEIRPYRGSLDAARDSGLLSAFDPIEAYAKWVTAPGKAGLRVSVIRDWFRDKLIVVDEMHGAGRAYMPKILAEIGVPFVVVHGRKDPKFGGLTYAAPEEPHIDVPRGLSDSVRLLGAHIGVGMDADADRFGVVDGNGVFYNPNKAIAMLTRYLLSKRKLRGKVIRSFTTFPLVDAVVEANAAYKQVDKPDKDAPPPYVQDPTYEVKIGKRSKAAGYPCYVSMVGIKYQAEAMAMSSKYLMVDKPDFLEGFVIAGEESGGVTTQGHLADKDGMWADLMILEMVAAYRKPLAEIWRDTLRSIKHVRTPGKENAETHEIQLDGSGALLERMIDHYLNGVPARPSSGRKVAGLGCAYLAGTPYDFVELVLKGRGGSGRLIVRASGTEPICRVYTEASSAELLRSIEHEVVDKFDEFASEEVDAITNPWQLLASMALTPPLPRTKAAVERKIRELSADAPALRKHLQVELVSRLSKLDTRRRMTVQRWLANVEPWQTSEILPPLAPSSLRIKQRGAFLFDYNGTLVERERGEELAAPTIPALLRLLVRGYRCAIVSTAPAESIRAYVVSVLERELRRRKAVQRMQNLIIYADGLGHRFYFEADGLMVEDEAYKADSTIPPPEADRVCKILDEALSLLWSGRAFVLLPKPKIYRNQTHIEVGPIPDKALRARALAAVDNALTTAGVGEEFQTETTGRRHFEIVRRGVDKRRAVADLAARWKLDPDATFYFGDEFREGGNDMAVLDSAAATPMSVNPPDERFRIPETVRYIGPGPHALKRFLKRLAK